MKFKKFNPSTLTEASILNSGDLSKYKRTGGKAFEDPDTIGGAESVNGVKNRLKDYIDLKKNNKYRRDKLNGKEIRQEVDRREREREEQDKKLTPFEAAMDEIESGQNQFLGKNYPNWGAGIKSVANNSFFENGFDSNDNKFIEYLELVKDNPRITNFGKDKAPALETIWDMLQDGELEINNRTSQWLNNPKAYESDDPVYKVKALTLATGEEGEKWGDTSKAPVDDVLDANKSSQILTILTRWQTRDGDTRSANRARDRDRGRAPQTAKEKKVAEQTKANLIKDLKNINKNNIEQYFDSVYTTTDTPGTVLNKIITAAKKGAETNNQVNNADK